MPFKETSKKKDDYTNIFDDNYKFSPPLSNSKMQKIGKIFTDGELKCNIKFDDQYVKYYINLENKS
jgi:hypothetical protein